MFLVADKGEIIFQQLYGFANIVTKRMLNDTLVFELVAVSKQFTATAILLVKDKGKLQLTDSLRKYFPELSYTYCRSITPHTQRQSYSNSL